MRGIRASRNTVLVAFAIAIAAGGAGRAQTLAPGLDRFPLTDLLEILLFNRELVAIDAESGGQTSADLRLSENSVWSGTRGRVGVVLTDQRIFAVGVGSAAWQYTEYQRGESQPDGALLGERVALIASSRRAIGFDGGSGNLVEYQFGLKEKLHSMRVGENVGIVVTNRKVLGLSPVAGGFFETRLQLHEEIRSVETRSNLATVTTNRRVLIFRAPSGSWSERKLDLNS